MFFSTAFEKHIIDCYSIPFMYVDKTMLYEELATVSQFCTLLSDPCKGTILCWYTFIVHVNREHLPAVN